MGGIENPRFLLNANSQRPNGLGNETDLVGRYFQEHPHFTPGIYVVDPANTALGRQVTVYATTDAYIRARETAGCTLRWFEVQGLADVPLRDRLKELVCGNGVLKSAYMLVDGDLFCPTRTLDKLVEGGDTTNIGQLQCVSEQVPNRESRVLLTSKRDAFGLRQAALNWRTKPIDARTQKVAAREGAKYLARTDQGRVRLQDWALDLALDLPDLSDGQEIGGFHHMGTTRMADSPASGVVDSDCRVFSTDNLYIAGSSVFPTGGYANPTFTLVQLALRLADHLATA